MGGWAGNELWEETLPDPTLTFLTALVGEGQALSLTGPWFQASHPFLGLGKLSARVLRGSRVGE